MNETTVGAGGNPIATTPEFHVQLCVTIEGTPTNPDLPTPSMDCISSTCPNAHGTWITLSPYDTGGVTEVTVNYTFDGQAFSRTVPLLGGSSGGGEECVFYIGRAVNNPGGCLVFYNHGL
jgi:hypothetical protein